MFGSLELARRRRDAHWNTSSHLAGAGGIPEGKQCCEYAATIQARSGADIPRDFLSTQPEGNPEQSD